MMKAAMLALVALAMLVAASIVSVAESVVTQKVANRASVITKFPGCVILGHHDWKDSPMSRDFAEDAHVDGVASAGACQDICFESWKNSKFRGIQVHKSSSYQAIFRHDGCYVEDTARWDCESSRAGDTNQFKQDTITDWSVMPCYRGQMTDWRDSSYWYTFDQFKYNSYSSDIRTATTGATGSHPPDKLTVEVADSPYICSWARSNQDYEEATVNQVPCLGWAYDSAMQRCSMSSTAPKEGSYTSPNSTTTRVTGSLYCENDFEEEDLARKIANIYETPGCMVKDIDWNGHDIGSKHAADTPHDCRRLCQENANCVVFVYRGTDQVCWLKTAEAVTNEKQVGSEQMYVAGLKDCHTCLPGYYITNSDPEDGLDSCEICPTKYHHCADGEVTPVEDMPGCMVKDSEWRGGSGAYIKRHYGVDTPHDCRRLCQKKRKCAVFVYRAIDQLCWLKEAIAATDHTYSTDIYSGLRNCHTCLPGFYPTKLNRYGKADSCYVDGIGPPASGGSQGLATGLGVSAAVVVTVLSALVV